MFYWYMNCCCGIMSLFCGYFLFHLSCKAIDCTLSSLILQTSIFRHLSGSHFLRGALHRRNKFENVRHDLMQNHLS